MNSVPEKKLSRELVLLARLFPLFALVFIGILLVGHIHHTFSDTLQISFSRIRLVEELRERVLQLTVWTLSRDDESVSFPVEESGVLFEKSLEVLIYGGELPSQYRAFANGFLPSCHNEEVQHHLHLVELHWRQFWDATGGAAESEGDLQHVALYSSFLVEEIAQVEVVLNPRDNSCK